MFVIAFVSFLWWWWGVQPSLCCVRAVKHWAARAGGGAHHMVSYPRGCRRRGAHPFLSRAGGNWERTNLLGSQVVSEARAECCCATGLQVGACTAGPYWGRAVLVVRWVGSRICGEKHPPSPTCYYFL